MGMVFSDGQTIENMKDNIRIIEKRVMELSDDLMADAIKDNGKMENKMEKVG